MVFKAMTEDILFIFITAYCVLNNAHCQFAGRRFNIATTNVRRPILTAHGHFGGQGGLPSFLSGGFSTHAPVNFRGSHPNRPRFNRSQFIRRHGVQAQNNGHLQRLPGGNSHSSLNEPHIVSLHRQNSFPNRIGYTSVSNTGRSNEQSRSFLPVDVHSIQNVQNARLQHQSRGIGTGTRHNILNKIGDQPIPPVREAAVSGRQISGHTRMPMLQSLSNGQVASYNIQTVQNVPGRTSWSSGSVSASGPHSVSRPLQAQSLHRSAHIPTPTISGISVFQTGLAENRLQPHHQFHGEQNEAFQYRTTVSRAPTSNQHVSWNNRPQFSGSAIPSLTLPFERLSLRYKGLKDSNKVKQNTRGSDTAKNLNERNPQRNFNAASQQTGLHVRGDPRQQTGIQFVGGTLQQTGTQYRDGSAQFRPDFTNIRRPAHNFDIARQRQGHIFPNRNVQNAGRSLHEVLGISTKGLQDAVRSSEVTKTRNRNQNSNNAQVVRNQSRGQRTGTQNGSQSSRNTNEQSQAKANLIADISRTLSLADRLKLFGEELDDNWLTSDAQSNKTRDRHVPSPPSSQNSVAIRLDSDANDSDIDETEDRLAAPNVSRVIPFSGKSARVYIVARNDYNGDDDDDNT